MQKCNTAFEEYNIILPIAICFLVFEVALLVLWN